MMDSDTEKEETSHPLLTNASPAHNHSVCSDDSKISQNIEQLGAAPDATNTLTPDSGDQTPSDIVVRISYEITPFSSTLSSLHPVCRICQNPAEKNNVLLTPCRCDGTLKYVHGACLRKWIEMRVKRRKYEFPYNCELCGYMYRKRKYIKWTEWKVPRTSIRDKILHTIFVLCLFIMITSAVVTVQHLISDSNNGGAHKYRMQNGAKWQLSLTELITLTCGITFFISFMVAVSVEIKSRHTIYEIIRKLIRYNTVWDIENYDKRYDTP